ncbi:MAG: DUF814 domain-containing protein [Bacteroidetes bacterium]|nr:DUF814 domain-containing protein [Bacteroidota bacterium]
MLIHNPFFIFEFVNSSKSLLVGTCLEFAIADKQEKLYLQFENNISIHAYFLNGNCYYTLFKDKSIDKKTSKPRFSTLRNKRVIEIKSVKFERIFYIEFEDGSILLFMLFGRHSNILLYESKQTLPKEIFRYNIENDKNRCFISLTESKSIGIHNNTSIQDIKFIPPEIIKIFPNQKFNTQEDLENFCYSFDIEWLWENNQIIPRINSQSKSNILETLQHFFQYSINTILVTELRNSLLKSNENELKKKKKTLAATQKYLLELQSQRSKKEIADLIMTNLHLFDNNKMEIIVDDFYLGTKTKITLPDTKTSPLKYAEKLYKKSSGIKQEIILTQSKIQSLESQIEQLQTTISKIASLNTYKELKTFTKSSDKEKQVANLPFHEYQIENFNIRIGKNDKSNDEMLAHYSNKNDYWLHAKDYAGSHVLIKRNNAEENIPENIVQTAASWAAWFSKGKNQSLLPVIVTLRKFVRKGKNLKPGQVIVEKEKTVLVRPANPKQNDFRAINK